MGRTHVFSRGEEIANAITHGIGAVLSLAALVLLIVYSSIYGTVWHIVSFTIFGITMLFMYLCSTLVHSLPTGKAKDIFEVLDHSAIYFFIAGTYTPFLFLKISGFLSWALFATVWGLAIAGTVFKSFYVKRFVGFSTFLYILMGWLIIFAWKPLVKNINQVGITLLVIGGILYTVGSFFYVWRSFKYHHAIWHLFVIAGSTLHFFAVILYLL